MSASIVLADDNDAFREVTGQLLERQGYAVVTAKDGREALAAVSRHKPDLVLLDIMMPDLDGITALKQIRDLDPLLAVVMVTAFGSEEMAVEALCHLDSALSHRGVGHFPKVFRPMNLGCTRAPSYFLTEKP